MYPINQVSLEHITRLGANELSELLHCLIKNESTKNNLEGWDASVPFNITTGDGGSDGRVKWIGLPETTKWFKNKFIIFQNKATDLFPHQCKEEILESKKRGQPRKLKSQIEKLAERDGCYVLFTNKAIVDSGKDSRIEEFRKGLKIAKNAKADSLQIQILDANSIKDWVNENIAAVTLVQHFNGINRPEGGRTWDELERDIRAKDVYYEKNGIIVANLSIVQQTIDTTKAIRIVGHSGIGKTRFVYECFNVNNESSNSNHFKKSIVYYDLNITTYNSLASYVIAQREHQNGILIVDNCDDASHRELSSLVTSMGHMKLISIGLDRGNSHADPIIKITRENQRDIVEQIVYQKIGNSHADPDVKYVARISEGYPLMALAFCDSILKKGIADFNKFLPEDFIEKLIFGDQQKDKIEYQVIRACSVFSAFGFSDDSYRALLSKESIKSLEMQMDFIREQIFDGTITQTAFIETCNKFRNVGLIEKVGIYYIVKPTILAINLAASWLKNTPTSRIVAIVHKLKDVHLDQRFVERLSDLDQLDKAKDLVDELWGPGTFFGSAEVLKTSWGSQLFRCVVDVNPIATAKALDSSFMHLSSEELLAVVEGRRNLVWALEKLCFRREAFNMAAKVLFAFAVAENETWANNATGQFTQLFHVYLAGTEVSLSQRLEVIRWGLKKNNAVYTKIAVLALAAGLKGDSFSRMGGAEKQGSTVPLKDYIPENHEEIAKYWSEIISILTPIAASNGECAEIAKSKIADSIYTLVRVGESNLLIDAIKTVAKNSKELWIEAINNLRRAIMFEKNLPKDDMQELESLIESITPNDFKDQLYLKVSKPEWQSIMKNDKGEYIDTPKQIAQSFAETIVNDKIDLEAFYGYLLTGEQRQAFNFGKTLGEHSDNGEKATMSMVNSLSKIPQNVQNPELIAGFLHGTNDKNLLKKTIDVLLDNENIQRHAFYITRCNQPDFDDITRLFYLIDRYSLPVTLFLNFQYGGILKSFAEEELIAFSKKLASYNSGNAVALTLLYMLCFHDPEKWERHKKLIKDILSANDLAINDSNSYHWLECVSRLLNEELDGQFAIAISNQILDFFKPAHFNYSSESNKHVIIRILLDKYFDYVWPGFANCIVGEALTFFHLKNAIGARNGNMGHRGILFESDVRNEAIFKWCKETGGIASSRIAGMMPLAASQGDQVSWHPFSKAILDEFGDDPDVLRQLSANMGTFGTMNSVIPYLNMEKALLTQLLTHKIDRVKIWATGRLSDVERRIKFEELEEEQRKLYE